MQVNKELVRLFMTNILDAHGNVVVMGEEEVLAPVETEEGYIGLSANYGTITLLRPLRLVLNEKGVIPATLFNSKNWARVPLSSSLEMDVHEKLLEMYVEYVNQEFGAGIILPQEKKLII